MSGATSDDAISGAEAIALHRRHLSKGRSQLASMFGSLVEKSASGARVTTLDGREFLNCGGYGVFFTGAGHPHIVRAVQRQAERQALSTRLFLDPEVGLAAQALTSVAPAGLDRVHFAGSGTEATETAVKLARAHGRRRLISMENGYHGKTLGALSLTAKSFYQEPFRPLLPDVRHVPFGDTGALAEALGTGDGEACVVVEPVQSEAGVVIPPPGYLAEVARLCRGHGAFLVVDEVMTGLGRLGAWWGCDLADVRPDVLLVGKALSGGVVPVSAALATPEAFAPFDADPFLHTSTYSGAPIAMAAVRATVEVVRDEGLVGRAAETGARLLDGLREIAAHRAPGLVREVRGQGLLIGVELAEASQAGELLLEMVDRSVLVNHSLNAHPVVRLTPPAVLTPDQEAQLLEAFDGALSAMAKTFS
ncbi:aspartate aminotransferase family protein [Streptomyces sp. NPDC054884]|uniref:aspartate aminotransferase family protein n=1 Tax=Streptomyces sp. ME08-AFT2 TaxID=3028683 RepID=UPI0029AAEDF6|nr:aminotransferase class III-fold pyridoxal phosphate-dependent enzyme [Streptomyces sp. ME08-AFT2]MDX3311258.1 aminotransferase class III-fold pyridoxal phosphate-dependent enzyme [Streptomyces sp. ME08-AFT2]